MAVAEAAPSRGCDNPHVIEYRFTHGARRSTKTFTTSATSRSPSCFVVTLTVHPGLMSSKGTGCSTKPGLPGSVERRDRMILDSARISMTTTRDFPFPGASTVRILATVSTDFTVPAIGASSAAATPTEATVNKAITRCRMGLQNPNDKPVVKKNGWRSAGPASSVPTPASQIQREV